MISVLIFGIVTAAIPFTFADCFNRGDTVIFGSYPQSLVTDEALISALDETEKEWISFDYCSGNGSEGSAKPGDFMKYADVELNGEHFRAVEITAYRPMKSHETHSAKSYQKNNGYKLNTVYWFRFEPLKWRILDAKAGLMMCESIIDSQPFNETVFSYGGAYYNDAEHRNPAHDYTVSSLRQWLNDDFYNCAFSDDEKAQIKDTTCEMQYFPSWRPSGKSSCADKVFLLSRQEATSAKYGFKTSMYSADPARCGKGTDYAGIQGLHVFEFPFPAHKGNSCWWLRAPAFFPKRVNKIFYDGYCAVDSYYYVGLTDIGVRPCMAIEL